MGTGTTDGFVYANYIGSYRSFGLSVNSSYRRSTENTFRNSLAPSTATFASLFYRIPVGTDWQLYPSGQFFYEKTKGEMLEGQLTGEHAMNNALLGPGLDLYYKNASLNTSGSSPFTPPKPTTRPAPGAWWYRWATASTKPSTCCTASPEAPAPRRPRTRAWQSAGPE
ncbi:hypothetical protein ACFQT0_12345 [Hymenobacter humi]|uniref:TonB-dependent receptor n=1 Tax=Hymenobacter humi TaxID=1411620 RepID=A0ABW2U3Y6_9BACT